MSYIEICYVVKLNLSQSRSNLDVGNDSVRRPLLSSFFSSHLAFWDLEYV